jgi:hypothetical protein
VVFGFRVLILEFGGFKVLGLQGYSVGFDLGNFDVTYPP